jgi:hypothetical protein
MKSLYNHGVTLTSANICDGFITVKRLSVPSS